MKQKRNGFTLVEIALFLAITGLLFMGIIIGTNNSIAGQRFNDSVQNFAELLKTVYSQVSNTQSVGQGRSDIAIYGKLISFGQVTGLDGERLDPVDQKIFIYDVVGNADASKVSMDKITKVLSDLDANVAVVTEWNGSSPVSMEPAGEVESYMPHWRASIETTSTDVKLVKVNYGEYEIEVPDNLYRKSILIVRHPQSGTINTLVYDGIIQVNEVLRLANDIKDFNKARTLLTDVLNSSDGFKVEEVDFCVNPDGAGITNDIRRDIRLVENARNASGVEVIDLDWDEIIDNRQVGNRCRF